jgi:WD40 repeat protein
LLADRDQKPRKVYAHGNWVSGIAFTAVGGAIATSGLDGRVRLWDFREDRELAVHSPGDYWLHTVAAHGSDPTTLYAGGTDGSVYAWLAGQDRPPAQYGEPFTWHAVLTLAVSHDNRYVAAGARGDIRIWDNVEAAFKRSIEVAASGRRSGAQVSPVCDIAFTPDATRLASASEDGAVRVWDWSTGRALRVMQAHDGAARAVAIVDDHLFSTGDDGKVRMWKLASPE